MRPITRYAIAILIGAIIPVVALIHVAKTANAAAQTEPDYRLRTIYFLLADRFNPHHPYVDPIYPDATNSVDCFTQSCTEEARKTFHCTTTILALLQAHIAV